MSAPHGDAQALGRKTRRGGGRIALAGELETFGLGTVMTILEMERASGVVEVRAGHAQAWLWWRAGRVVRASIRGVAVRVGREAIFESLTFAAGSFAFRAGPVVCADEIGSPVPQLLMMAAQRMDELVA